MYRRLGVYRMCQCPLFKQFTTNTPQRYNLFWVFIVCVNVLFLSNSQHEHGCNIQGLGVYRMCQCPLFKQFTTNTPQRYNLFWVFIVCVNVLFLSNSQHNLMTGEIKKGVYRMCQCPLFKQFTTKRGQDCHVRLVFIVCVNVLFLSNSQQPFTQCRES